MDDMRLERYLYRTWKSFTEILSYFCYTVTFQIIMGQDMSGLHGVKGLYWLIGLFLATPLLMYIRDYFQQK